MRRKFSFFSPAEATRGKDNSKSNDMHLAASRNATGGEETERVTPSLARVGSRRATGQQVDEQIAKTHKDMPIRPWTDTKVIHQQQQIRHSTVGAGDMRCYSARHAEANRHSCDTLPCWTRSGASDGP